MCNSEIWKFGQVRSFGLNDVSKEQIQITFFHNFKDLQERQGFESLQLSTRLIEDPDEETPEQTSAEEKRNF